MERLTKTRAFRQNNLPVKEHVWKKSSSIFGAHQLHLYRVQSQKRTSATGWGARTLLTSEESIEELWTKVWHNKNPTLPWLHYSCGLVCMVWSLVQQHKHNQEPVGNSCSQPDRIRNSGRGPRILYFNKPSQGYWWMMNIESYWAEDADTSRIKFEKVIGIQPICGGTLHCPVTLCKLPRWLKPCHCFQLQSLESFVQVINTTCSVGFKIG